MILAANIRKLDRELEHRVIVGLSEGLLASRFSSRS
jgi:hypothetical protein